jgi:hypothetical protein
MAPEQIEGEEADARTDIFRVRERYHGPSRRTHIIVIDCPPGSRGRSQT